MNLKNIFAHIRQHYGVEPEYPWSKFPDYAVFRHCHHRKWFAVLINIEAYKIGLSTMKTIWVLNVKAKPEEIGFLRMIKGVYPAYHMNKEHWLSLNLTEIDERLLNELIDESFSLTFKK